MLGRRSPRRSLVAAVAVAALAVAGCSEPEERPAGGQDANGPIKIGAVLDVTGAGASLGGPERDTLQLLAEKVNAAGGIRGRMVEVHVRDDRSAEDEAARAMNQLVDDDKVDLVLGASRTGTSLAMRPVAEASSVPMISLAADARIVQGARWVFKTAQNDQVVVDKLVAYMELKGWKTIGLLRDSSAFGEGIADLFNQAGGPKQVRVVAEERFAPGATGFDAQLVKLRDAKADVNVVWGMPPAAAIATRRYRELKLRTPLLHSHGIGDQAFLDAAGDSADGVVFPTGKLLVAGELPDGDPQRRTIGTFVDDYRAMYRRSPSTDAGNAWDGFMLAVDAFTKVGTDKAKVRGHLEGMKNFVGISGVFTFGPEDHSGLDTSALVMAEVEGGGWKLAPDQVP
jgi:branched-chain amino acid transport system substrate-binding protein